MFEWVASQAYGCYRYGYAYRCGCKEEELVQKVCSTALNLFRILMIMIEPVTPKLSNKSFTFLNEEPSWKDIENPLSDHQINAFKPLLTRIEDEHIKQLMELKNV